MPTSYPASYYDRFDSAKNYEKHVFRAGKNLQSAELNELQSASMARMKGFGDSIFKDGDIIRDARIVVNSTTGVTICESGSIYLSGAVRGVIPKTITIATVGIVTVGIYLQQQVLSETDDTALRDPAMGLRNFQEAGAWRLKVEPVWGYAGDGSAGDFFPVYVVENGVLRAKEPPPNYDAIAQTLARYDRDSAGGTYVVSGFTVSAADDLVSGEQVYTVSEGRARVNGYGIEQGTGRRLVYPATTDLRAVDSEPMTSATASAQRVNLARGPVATITSVHITAEKTVTVTHGGYLGVQDPLPDTSILSVSSVVQASTTYVATTDYLLTSGKIDWTPTGDEPAPGSTYQVTYQYITTVAPTAVDSTGYTVTGAVAGSLILSSYSYKLPRIDRLAVSAEGEYLWFKGTAADWNPQPPVVPLPLLALASINQVWGDGRSVANDGVRVVPMTELSSIQEKIDRMAELIAQQRLTSDASFRESGTKKGMFVDPFLSDDMRDAGIAQTAAIFDGELTLPVTASVASVPSDITGPVALPLALASVVSQGLRTGTMAINPYLAFAPIPAVVTLTPAIDQWTDIQTAWASSITRAITTGSGSVTRVTTTSADVVLSTSRSAIENLRQIEVRFSASGFGANEVLSSVTFDGVSVIPSAL
jgi:hypothetical protein